ncbi:hypothetical protein [Endozoicomonas elysicola]|uniref:Uncharacterized protein n=1 Tax=Endozoicomonas elysicola TaxID=305900 RepID=A0A081KFD6_9GAMM|nr:hypothetical protein [Endozoicomonas elysicola]KEI72862.1 hypothetical protein GV64_20965 [Endozoicomonas elysicola]
MSIRYIQCQAMLPSTHEPAPQQTTTQKAQPLNADAKEFIPKSLCLLDQIHPSSTSSTPATIKKDKEEKSPETTAYKTQENHQSKHHSGAEIPRLIKVQDTTKQLFPAETIHSNRVVSSGLEQEVCLLDTSTDTPYTVQQSPSETKAPPTETSQESEEGQKSGTIRRETMTIVTTEQQPLPELPEAIQEQDQPQVKTARSICITSPTEGIPPTNSVNKKETDIGKKVSETTIQEITPEILIPPPAKLKGRLDQQIALLYCRGIRLPHYDETGLAANLALLADLGTPESCFTRKDTTQIKERSTTVEKLSEHIKDHPDFKKIVTDLKRFFQTMGDFGMVAQAFAQTPSAESLINQTMVLQFPFTNPHELSASLGPFLPPIHFLFCATESILIDLQSQSSRIKKPVKLSNLNVIRHLTNIIKILEFTFQSKLQQLTEALKSTENNDSYHKDILLHVKFIVQLVLTGTHCYGSSASDRETQAMIDMLDLFISHAHLAEQKKDEFPDLFFKFVELIVALIQEKKITDILAGLETIHEEKAKKTHDVYLKPFHIRHLNTQRLLLSAIQMAQRKASRPALVSSILLACSRSNLFSPRNTAIFDQPYINEYTETLLHLTTRLIHLLQEGPLLPFSSHRALAKAVKDKWLPSLSCNIPKLMGRKIPDKHNPQEILAGEWTLTAPFPANQNKELLDTLIMRLRELAKESEKANAAFANEKQNHDRIKAEVKELLDSWEADSTITGAPLDTARRTAENDDLRTNTSPPELSLKQTKGPTDNSSQNTSLSVETDQVKQPSDNVTERAPESRDTHPSSPTDIANKHPLHQLESSPQKHQKQALSTDSPRKFLPHQTCGEKINEKQRLKDLCLQAASNLPFPEMSKELESIDPLATRHPILRFWQCADIATRLLEVNKEGLAQLHVKICTINSLYNLTLLTLQHLPQNPPMRNAALLWLDTYFPNQELSESPLLLLSQGIEDSVIKKSTLCISNILQLLQHALWNGQYLFNAAQKLGHTQSQLASHFCVSSIDDLRQRFEHIIAALGMLTAFEATLTQPIFVCELFTAREHILDSLGLGPRDHRNIISKPPSQIKKDFRNAIAIINANKHFFEAHNASHGATLSIDSHQLRVQLTSFSEQFLTKKSISRSAS